MRYTGLKVKNGLEEGRTDIAYGGKSLHIAFGDIIGVMFQGFKEG